MKQIARLALATVALLALTAPAFTQSFPATMPPQSVYGRLGTVPGPGQAIPIETLAQMITQSAIQGPANTIFGNFTPNPGPLISNTMPSCPDTGGQHLNFTNNIGFGCGTSSLLPLTNVWTGSSNIFKGKVAIGNVTTPVGFFTINQSGTDSASDPSPGAGVTIFTQVADGVQNRIYLQSYGNWNIFRGNRADGSMASKTPVVNGDILSQFSGGGWDGGTYSQSAVIYFTASQTWTSSNHGSWIQLDGTPNGAAGPVASVRIQPTGGLVVGGANFPTDPGNGNILTTGLTIAGITGSGVQCLQASATGVVSGSGGVCGAVTSFNTRTGAVVPAANDYSFSQISGQIAPSQIPPAAAVNTVRGAATSTTITDLAVPSCSGGTNALTWTTGTGFGCNTIPGAVSSVSAADATLTITPTTGVVTAKLALGNANTWTATQTLSGLKLSGITGSVQCLHVDSTGTVSGTTSDCGSSGGGGTNYLPLNNIWTGQNTYAPSVAGNAIAINGPSGSGFNTLDVNQTYSAPGPTNLIAAFTGYGDPARVTIRSAAGTQSSPGQTTVGAQIGSVNWRGYTNAPGFVNAANAAIAVIALDNFTSSAQGTAMQLTQTPAGSNLNTVLMQLQNNQVGIGVGVAAAPDSLLTVNANTVAGFAPPAGTTLHLMGPDTSPDQITIDGFSGAAAITGRRSEGTSASKAIVGVNVSTTTLQGLGWDGSAYGTTSFIQLATSETFTTSAHGGSIRFWTTPLQSTAFAEVMRLHPSGGLSVGSANTATDPGSGYIRANSIVTSNSRASNPTSLNLNSTQTTPQATDAADGAASIFYNLSANSATNELVNRVLSIQYNNGLTGGGHVQNLRHIEIDTSTVAGSVIDSWAAIYIGAVSGSGTITSKSTIFDNSGGNWYMTGAIQTALGQAVATIAAGQMILNTTPASIPSGSCATPLTATATGTQASDTIVANFIGDPTSVAGFQPLTTGMLTVWVYPSANQVNFKVCNTTAAALGPGGPTLNWRVIR